MASKGVLFTLALTWSAAWGQWTVDPTTLPTMPDAPHTCKMWGLCTTVGGFSKSCRYEGAAPRLLHDGLSEEIRAEILDILETRCPQFLFDSDGNRKPDDEVYTCCSSEQLMDSASSFPLADGVLGRCPACLRNFVAQICEMNCSPEQSRFLDVNTVISNDLEYIDEIDYRMHEDFMLESHASCSGVLVPQTGLPAINLMCGSASVCDAESWYGYSGDAVNNPFVGTQVNFIRWPTAEDSMDITALRCNETFGDDLQCSCVDCFSSCPSGMEPVVPSTCTVWSVNCIGFSVGITFFVISITIVCVLAMLEYRKMRKNNDSKEPVNTYSESKLITVFGNLFACIARFSASYPVFVILLTSWIAFALSFGVARLNITSDTIELWSSPTSKSRTDLDYFNSRFGPFYRTAQVFLQFNGLESFERDNITYGPAFRLEALQALIEIEDAIANINRGTGGVLLENVCYAPLRRETAEESLDDCAIMSASLYLAEDRYSINNETYLNRIMNCLNNYFGLDCLASWGGGAEPEIAFGGFDEPHILTADTLVLNIPINNHLIKENLEPAREWELEFVKLMEDYERNQKPDYIDVSYSAERSIQDEIERVSKAEAVPIAVSYVFMFLYAILALGKFKSLKTFLVNSKILVAIGGIIVVITSIFCAMGAMGFLGITTTLLAINVIPFFILSVGIDNVFLMVNTLQQIEDSLSDDPDYNPNLSPHKKQMFIFTKMMKNVGPSIFVTSTTQITCFAIGTTSNFPAVTTFAAFASLSLAFLFVFQITTVIAILSADYKRSVQQRLDVFFCIRKKILDDSNPLASEESYIGVTQWFVKVYSKFIVQWKVKVIVAIIFMTLVSVSIILIPQIEIGLDQELALPSDSYVYKYLQSVANLFRLGAPVYFVLKTGLNFTNPDHQNVICGGQLCNADSLTTQIYLASLYPDITYIQRSSNSWLDDYFDWSGLSGSCCKYNIEDGSFCESTNTSNVCAFCEIGMNEYGIRPDAESFQKYLPTFLQDPPTDSCSKGGLASYFNNVNYMLDSEGKAYVGDSNFMAYHKRCSVSRDYITAIANAYEISENITASIKANTGLDIEVFPYSIFYPYYEQYLTMWGDTFTALSYSFIGATLIIFLTSGFNFITTFAVIFTSILVVVNMMGVMYIWNIPLNAVSCVNLIVSLGISVEFCSHLAYAFGTSKSPPKDKVSDALVRVGATIITGITFTNIPIVLLAFSYTEIIEIFFFRMFSSIVILSFMHGMIFLPVLLSYINDYR